MKILAIDSSGMPASCAVCEDSTLLAEYTVNFKRTHSQTLVPMLDEIRTMLEMDLESVDAVAVAGGPGSFTGLRIGSAAAKGIGLALNKPLVHVPTLEGMACNFYGSSSLVVPMIDARNRQVFAGIYSFVSSQGTEATSRTDAAKQGKEEMRVSDNGKTESDWIDPLCVFSDQEALRVTDLCERLNAMARETGKEAILLGDGAAVYRELIEQNLTAPHWYAPAHLAQQKAGSLAARAMDLARQGKLESAAAHRPDYLRVSQAERVRAQKEGR